MTFDMPRIVYSEDDERALEDFARAKGAQQLPFSVSLAIILIPFFCAGSAVITCYHSVSSSLLYAVRDVVKDHILLRMRLYISLAPAQ
jgi:hypothetical protein